jgi:hypothetical protein
MRYNVGESRAPWSFLIIASLIVGVFDGVIGYGLVFQLQALRYFGVLAGWNTTPEAGAYRVRARTP